MRVHYTLMDCIMLTWLHHALLNQSCSCESNYALIDYFMLMWDSVTHIMVTLLLPTLILTCFPVLQLTNSQVDRLLTGWGSKEEGRAAERLLTWLCLFGVKLVQQTLSRVANGQWLYLLMCKASENHNPACRMVALWLYSANKGTLHWKALSTSN